MLVSTGQPSSSTISSSSALASARSTPVPAITTGRCAEMSISAACSIWAAEACGPPAR